MKALTLVLPSVSSSCLWLLLVLSLCSICFCNKNSDDVLCIPSERFALIDLKNNFTDPLNRLSSWVGKDCCTWSGVVCDNFTGHVHEIHLRGPDDGIHGHCKLYFDTDDEPEEASKQTLGGTISPSVIKLLQLQYLDLSCNNFGYTKIPAFLGSFQSLIYLNISRSHFSGEIPHQLGNLSTLSVLDLYDESYFFSLHSKSLKWLENLKGLQYLDMSGIDLPNASDWFLVISNLTSLLELHFSSCVLNGLPNNSTADCFKSLFVLDLSFSVFDTYMLPGWIFNLRDLVLLDLTSCGVSGINHAAGFHNMPSLRTLLVSDNSFMNSSRLLNGLSSLSNLRMLDVSWCDISSPILGSLVHLPFIEYLVLFGNQIVEEIPKSFSNRCNFTTLELQFNKFYGNVSDFLETLCDCDSAKLQLLDLRNNHLIGRLPERLGNLKNLEVIYLSSNQLTGTIPDSFGSLSLLQSLDMSSNQLSGSIPDTIGGLSLLGFLDLSNNKLNGSLPQSIGHLSKLYSLDLHSNLLTGIVTENHFDNLTALKTLWITDNKLVFKFHVNNWIPPFKLMDLRAVSCSLGPRFPLWIQSQTDLTYLDVSNTNISDTIPKSFWTALSSLYHLNISHNSIQGKLGVESLAFRVLDLSNNRLHGMLPGSFNPKSMDFLDLSNNNLSGSLEQYLCSGIQEQQELTFLNLANNSLSGVIPDCWMNWQSLVFLNLEKNQFSGIIPSSLGSLTSLQSLDLDGNKLSGNLPPWLLNSRSLVIVDLAQNELTGKIPSSIGGDYTKLRVLNLRSNNLEGKIPDEMCNLIYLQILDLADNHLFGNIPTCFAKFYGSWASSPFNLNTSYNSTIPDTSLVTKGFDYTYSTILYQVTSLDLSNNKLSGTIPDELIGLSGLRFLNLSHNDLTGRIPNLFNKFAMLECLDLSMNHLNGSIPLSLSVLTALSWLNVSYNNLKGRIPTGPQLQTFNMSSFTGNALCGDPLPVCLPNKIDNKGSKYKGHDGTDWILVILAVAGLVVGFWIVVIPLFLSKRWRKAYYHFLGGIWFKLQTFMLMLFICLKKMSRSRSSSSSSYSVYPTISKLR